MKIRLIQIGIIKKLFFSFQYIEIFHLGQNALLINIFPP